MPEPIASGPLGLLGGTFDPVHRGHLALAQAALAAGAIDRLRWLPAGTPPHRPPPGAPGRHRLAMVRLAVESLPAKIRDRCEIDAGEVESAEPSYTIDTLDRLRRDLGARRPLALILGADAFLGLPSWHRWTELLARAHLLITERPGHGLSPERLPDALRPFWQKGFRADPAALASAPCGLIHAFSMPATDLSATRLRALFATGDQATAANFLPADVVRYIRQHRLYTEPNGHPDPAENRH